MKPLFLLLSQEACPPLDPAFPQREGKRVRPTMEVRGLFTSREAANAAAVAAVSRERVTCKVAKVYPTEGSALVLSDSLQQEEGKRLLASAKVQLATEILHPTEGDPPHHPALAAASRLYAYRPRNTAAALLWGGVRRWIAQEIAPLLPSAEESGVAIQTWDTSPENDLHALDALLFLLWQARVNAVSVPKEDLDSLCEIVKQLF